MSAETGVSGGRPLALRATAETRTRDHRFFTAMAAACAVVVFVGFAPSYYLRSTFGGRELATLVHLHGALSTGWILLFLTQASLVLTGRTAVHRRLGIAAAALVPALLAVGYLTAVEAARHGVTPPGGPPPLAFLAIPLGTIFTFAVLAAAGLAQRRRSETHKRLMLLATIAMLMPAFARMRWLGHGGPPVAIGGTLVLLLACLSYDRATHGRVHPAFLWGSLFLVATIALRLAAAGSEAWLPVAAWLTR